MGLIKYLFIRPNFWQMLLISIATIIAGLCSAGLAMVIGRALNDESQKSLLAIAFFSLCFFHIAAKSASDIALLKVIQSIIVRLRVELSNKIITTSYKKLQKIGRDGLMVILTRDISSFA